MMSQNLMTVSALNTKIKSLLETTFMHILVEGEVASVTYHTSGHLYFSIKDDKSVIKCVMWRSSVARMKFRIEKGMHVVVEGSVSVYMPRGEYQFQAVKIEPYGQGALALAFEQLKEKLKAKGYFDVHHKKSIPKQIHKIALVTAKESAALHDMLKIIEKRWPLLEVTVVDTLVQGEHASGQIARSLKYADRLGVDVVIVGRGGGSTEDLWAFNEEPVADAIFAMHTPVVSAVGHEVDVLISDHVADLRAPTPSAAVEMVLPDQNEIFFLLDEYMQRFESAVEHVIVQKKHRLEHIQTTLLHQAPLRRLTESEYLFRRMEDEYKRLIRYQFEQMCIVPDQIKEQYRHAIDHVLRSKMQQWENWQEKVRLANPKMQCKKGWAQVLYKGGTVELAQIEKGETFIVEDATGRLEAFCLEILKKKGESD